MSVSYEPYNISFNDKAPLFYYLPYRGGSDNDTVHEGTDHDCWYAVETTSRESSYTTYLVGATVTLEWQGTAIWLFGEADEGAYVVTRSWNGSDVTGVGSASREGVLYTESGLSPYALNTITLTVREGPVTITGATVTAGMGEPGSAINLTTISTISQGLTTVNPFFVVNPIEGWWGSTAVGGNIADPVLRTSLGGASVSFDVASSVGFAVYGGNSPGNGVYRVDVDPPVSHSPNTSGVYQFNATTPWDVYEELSYFATGLDRTKTYTVTMTNNGSLMTLDHVVLFDAIPPVSSSSAVASASSSSSTSSSHPSQNGVSVGVIVAIIIGSAAAALFVAFMIFVLLRRRRSEASGERTVHRTSEDVLMTFSSPGEIAAILPNPYMHSYADLPSSPPAEATDRSSLAGVLHLKSEAGSSAPDPRPVGEPPAPLAQAVSGPTVYEDAGPVPVSPPPVYNPAWNSGSAREA